jgi:uncharacterized membrane protein YgcG
MKTLRSIALLSLLALSGFAADYSTMTTTEMQAMRGSVPEADRASFQAEMQTRAQAMTQEERQAMTTTMKQSRSGSQDGSGSQMRNSGMRSGSSGGGMQHRGGR